MLVIALWVPWGKIQFLEGGKGSTILFFSEYQEGMNCIQGTGGVVKVHGRGRWFGCGSSRWWRGRVELCVDRVCLALVPIGVRHWAAKARCFRHPISKHTTL